jgi:plastocyanin
MNQQRSCVVGRTLIGVFLIGQASAGELSVLVTDARSAPVADAVVSVRGGPDSTSPLGAPITKTIDQRRETFIPYVEIFRPGDQVAFHNSDHTRHHVYSFAPTKSFEFVVASGRTSSPVTLDLPGEIDVGCNIHDRMITHLYVSDAPYVAKSTVDGRVSFDGLAAGAYSVQVWHPQLRPGKEEPPLAITLDANPANVTIPVNLLADPRAGANDPERSQY